MKKGAQNGQSLVEMVVVVAIVALLATGIVSGTTASLRRANASGMRSRAVSFAREGLELARAKRDAGWESFVLLGEAPTTYCLGTNGAFEEALTCAGNLGEFTRSIEFALSPGPPVEKMDIKVTVGWADQSPGNKVSLSTFLTQWK